MCRAAHAFWQDEEPSPLEIALAACVDGTLLAPPDDGRVYAVVEDDAAIRFDEVNSGADGWQLVGGSVLTAWRQGRVFGSLGELCWRRREGWIHAVLVTDAEGTLPDSFEDVLPLPAGESALHLLWGEWEREAWREGQVPVELHYPVSLQAEGRVWLRVQQYRDKRGVIALSRYAGLAVKRR